MIDRLGIGVNTVSMAFGFIAATLVILAVVTALF